MVSEVYRASFGRYQAAQAAALGCRVQDWASNDLVVVERPPGSPEKYLAMLVTFGTGTVLSVEPEYLELARSFAFDRHYLAFAPASVALPMCAAAEARGEKVNARGPNLGFLLGAVPGEPGIPAGLRLQRVDAELRARWVPGGHFSNALGDELADAPLWRFGLALVAGEGEPAAVTGAWEDRGEHLEIGLDVAREFRGQGLAQRIVALMTREVLDMGAYPTYFCAPTNVRSHRTALSCGFVPTLSAAAIRRVLPAPA